VNLEINLLGAEQTGDDSRNSGAATELKNFQVGPESDACRQIRRLELML